MLDIIRKHLEHHYVIPVTREHLSLQLDSPLVQIVNQGHMLLEVEMLIVLLVRVVHTLQELQSLVFLALLVHSPLLMVLWNARTASLDIPLLVMDSLFAMLLVLKERTDPWMYNAVYHVHQEGSTMRQALYCANCVFRGTSIPMSIKVSAKNVLMDIPM